MIDIVLPEKNEDELVEMAQKVGYSSICLAYKNVKEIREPKEKKIGIHYAIINPQNIDIARKTANLIIGRGDARELIEKSKIDLFLFEEETQLNHIICKIASQKEKIIGFPFSLILETKNRAKLMERISNTIMLCQKYKTKMAFFSFAKNKFQLRNPRDMMSFFSLLGMKNPKEAINSIDERIERNIKIREGKIPMNGIEMIE